MTTTITPQVGQRWLSDTGAIWTVTGFSEPYPDGTRRVLMHCDRPQWERNNFHWHPSMFQGMKLLDVICVLPEHANATPTVDP